MTKPKAPRGTEMYVVKFWFQKEDGYWEQRTADYFAHTKDSHEKVEQQWREEYRGKAVRLISVIYQ